jgi:hypothetical protein
VFDFCVWFYVYYNNPLGNFLLTKKEKKMKPNSVSRRLFFGSAPAKPPFLHDCVGYRNDIKPKGKIGEVTCHAPTYPVSIQPKV